MRIKLVDVKRNEESKVFVCENENFLEAIKEVYNQCKEESDIKRFFKKVTSIDEFLDINSYDLISTKDGIMACKAKECPVIPIKANELRKVKSCPFCGESENIYLEEYETKVGNRWRILCGKCMGGIDRGYDQTPHSLIDAWNKRA